MNLDNAATTPPFKAVAETVDRFTPWYSSVHRGTGYKSRLSTHVYEEARRITGDFVGIDRDSQSLIFTQHTTDSVNRLARRFPLENSDLVLNTVMEHHANLLPWTRGEQVVHVGLEAGGRGPELDLADVEAAFDEYGGRIRLLAVTGASNVTGSMPPVHELAELAHRNGALIFVDGAQLVPHRKVDVLPADDPRHIDFLAFSAHKMYAPYGTGVLVGPRAILGTGTPAVVGGGAVDAVRLDEVLWTELPEREEAGSPNLIGAVALARACRVLGEYGMDRIAEHERSLTVHALERLKGVPGLRIIGDSDPGLGRDRVAVFAFTLEGYRHAELAAILGFEYGIAVRNGCFCAHPYIKVLAGVSEEEDRAMWEKVQRGDRSDLPGFVRASAGCYTTLGHLDALADALHRITEEGPATAYHPDPSTGQYLPEGSRFSFRDRFSI
ncbi:MAG: aminotransferase class V-fold PLP-dependent enzyme [bacterium]